MGAPDVTFSSLAPDERNLVRLMQSIGRGRLAALQVRDGLPMIGPTTKVVRLVQLRRRHADTRATKPVSTDFPIGQELIQLLSEIRAMRHGLIERLEICDGLPTCVELAEPIGLTHPLPTSIPMPAA